MDEHASSLPAASGRLKRILTRLGGFPRVFRPSRRSGGQAVLEYILVLLIAFTFTHQVFFNSQFGFNTVIKKTMLRLGSFLEQNLKSGTKVGGNGRLSLDPYAGTDTWSN